MKKKRLLYVSILILCAIILSLICLNIRRHNKANIVAVQNNEIRKAMTYNEITASNANVDNCDYVKFNSFFTRDLDGDGNAEKYDGTCNYIDQKPSLYFDISVVNEGKLENGKIKINGKNFDLSTSLIKDDVLKNNYIGNEINEIELNTMNFGTQKTFSGTINADIKNNINNYSVDNNEVIFTGTWVSSDGSKKIEINKVINLKTDWYGKTSTSSYVLNPTNHDINSAIGNNEVTLDFYVGYEEVSNELLIKKQVTEIEIPDFNGYVATSVITRSPNCNYNYDKNTKILTIPRDAIVDNNGFISQGVSRYNNYEIQVKYPLQAYSKLESKDIDIIFSTKGYYYGYNNNSSEFTEENPYVSSESRDFSHTWSENTGYKSDFYVSAGNFIWDTDSNSIKSVISKRYPLNIYNNLGVKEDEKDEYIVTWRAYTGESEENQNGVYMQEKQEDKFLNSDKSYISMNKYIKTTGIYFRNLEGCLSDDGWVKVYDKDTNEILLTITKENFKKYEKDTPYLFTKNVKGIKIETSKTNLNSTFFVHQIKEIDDELVTNDFSYKDFEKLDRKKQLEYMGNLYNAEILGKEENEFTIEDAEKDFLQICDFNYLRDKENTEEKEENSV